MSTEIRVINFSHPITQEQMEQIMRLTGAQTSWYLEQPVMVDFKQPLVPQIRELVDNVEKSLWTWEGPPIVVLPPGSSLVAVVLIAELYRRMGKFPICAIRASSGMPPEFVVTEIIDLNEVAEQTTL